MNIYHKNKLDQPEMPTDFFSGTLPPVRGLIFSHNKFAKPYGLLCFKKWMRLHSSLLKAEKVDLFFSDGNLEEWNEL